MKGGTGSFKYMAPEVFMGQKANERLDIYSWVRLFPFARLLGHYDHM